MPFNIDYYNATRYFPAEPFWGSSFSTTPTTVATTAGGGDVIITGGTTINNITNTFTINNYNGVLTVSASGSSISSGSLVFANSNSVSFGMNGGTITASFGGGGGGMTASAGTQSAAGSLSFANSNGITAGMNASTITFSYNSTQFLGTAYTTHTHSQYFNTSQSSLFEQASHTSVFLTTQLAQALSGSNGSFSFQTATFGNLNGVSFYTSNGSIVASINALTSQSNQALSGSNGSFTFQTATFGNLNGISHYVSNGSLVASHNALTSQSNQALSGSNGSFAFQTATFGNLNGASFYTSNGSMVLSYTVPAANILTIDAANDGPVSYNYLSLDHAGTWAGAQGVAFTLSTGGGGSGTLYAAHNGLTTAQNVITWEDLGNGTTTLDSIVLDEAAAWASNAIGLFYSTLGGGAASLVAYDPNPYRIENMFALGNTTLTSSGTVNQETRNFRGLGIVSVGVSNDELLISASQSNQALGLYASSQTTGQSSSSTVDARSFSIRGAGNVSVGLSAGEFIISGSAAAGGIQAVYDGANSISSGTIRVTNANGVTLSINGQTLSGSVSTQPTVSFFEPWNAMGMQANGLGNGTFSLDRLLIPNPIAATRMALLQHYTGSTGAANGCSITYFAGLYTMNGSTASLLHSATFALSFDLNSNTNVTSAYGGHSGTRYRTIDIGTWNITPGDYLIGIGLRESTAGTSVTISHYCHPHVSLGPAVGGGNFVDFFINGAYSATTTTPPASIHITDINQSGAAGQIRSPYFVLVGT